MRERGVSHFVQILGHFRKAYLRGLSIHLDEPSGYQQLWSRATSRAASSMSRLAIFEPFCDLVEDCITARVHIYWPSRDRLRYLAA